MTIETPMAAPRALNGDGPHRDHRSFLWAVFALAIVGLWLPAITSSLWLDEAGTWWVIKDGLSASIDRAARYQGQTPAYYVLEWIARHVLGRSELMLRLPSLLAMGAAVYFLYRLAKRLFDPETAIVAAIIFATTESVAFAAIDARPYAFALLTLLASTLTLVRWLDGESKRDPYLYVVLVAAMIYLHFIFAIGLIPQAVYAYIRRRRIDWRAVIAVVAGLVLLLSPALPQLWSLFHRRHALSVRTGPAIHELKFLAVPLSFVWIAMCAIAARGHRMKMREEEGRPGSVTLALSFLTLPGLALFVVSQYTPTHIFSSRYLLTMTPGVALAVALVIGKIHPERARRLIVVGILLASVLLFGGRYHHDPDEWRDAIAKANHLSDQRTPVLFQGGFVESAQIDWMTRPEQASYLMAPISYYPLRGRAIPLPYFGSPAARAYVRGIADLILRGVDHFVVVQRYEMAPFRRWLDGQLRTEGYTSRLAGRYGGIVVFDFTRPHSA